MGLAAVAALCLIAGPSLWGQTAAGSITIDRIAEIRYPTNPAWSPDGARVAFLWDHAGKQDLYVASPGSTPVAVTNFPVDPATLQSDLGAFTWLSSSRILFSRGGQLWSVSVDERRPARLSGIDGDGAFDVSADRRQIVFARGSEILASSLEQGASVSVVRLADGMRPSTLAMSLDSRLIAFVASRSSTEVHPLPFNGTRIRSMRNVVADRRTAIVSAHGGEPFWIPAMGDTSLVGWSAAGELLYEETSPDRKTRTILSVPPGGAARVIWRDHDPAWFSPTRGPATVLSPDGRQVAFFSDRTGWTHLYVASTEPASSTPPVALTSGKFTVGYPAWAPDSQSLAYAHGDVGNQLERRISVVELATRRVTSVVSTPGVQIFPDFSPDGRHLLYQRTTFDHSLDLYVTTLTGNQTATRLTDSMPAGLVASDFTRPEFVSYPSLVDGKTVPATLMVSSRIDRTRKNPAIVWIHGSGSDQNYLGWHPLSYRMYYSMHQYLTQQGYVILTPDYRGSSGYDRDWATGNYLDLGGDDMRDVVSGVDYLKTLDYVDPERVGVWGLSYGGFMTLQAVTAYPTVFRAAIDVAGVTDWAPRAGGWTVARLGSPAEHPEAYERSAPARHMDTLARPLLILHGTADTNVAFHDTLTLIDSLLKLGKPFETAIYPGEPHFFRRAHVLRDAWRRAEAFFDQHLRQVR
jgi:dipeptidyl aminopeptidase/acylaminoacyl peptidase